MRFNAWHLRRVLDTSQAPVEAEQRLIAVFRCTRNSSMSHENIHLHPWHLQQRGVVMGALTVWPAIQAFKWTAAAQASV